jgi:hypothetical protein
LTSVLLIKKKKDDVGQPIRYTLTESVRAIMMVRSYILTKHERQILERALETGDKLDGYAVLTHHLRRAQKQLKADLDLIQKAVKTE